ncbi:MAG: hypothetical protein CMJ79_04110 [Planctomycetaceae bacterium]|nr:hypothetical protein [Planctomycetaceae bacterium]|tara:strand:+ start:7536 stop:7718 length:183 start_codon:yes stop_codon:yes gene_type:complete
MFLKQSTAYTFRFGQASILPKSPADLKHMCLNVDGRRGGQPNEQQMGMMEMGMMGREKAS